jgi:hypothetical protein
MPLVNPEGHALGSFCIMDSHPRELTPEQADVLRKLARQAASLLDISGRKVLDLKSGANDVRALAPGVYFVREEPQAIRKVIISR